MTERQVVLTVIVSLCLTIAAWAVWRSDREPTALIICENVKQLPGPGDKLHLHFDRCSSTSMEFVSVRECDTARMAAGWALAAGQTMEPKWVVKDGLVLDCEPTSQLHDLSGGTIDIPRPPK